MDLRQRLVHIKETGMPAVRLRINCKSGEAYQDVEILEVHDDHIMVQDYGRSGWDFVTCIAISDITSVEAASKYFLCSDIGLG